MTLRNNPFDEEIEEYEKWFQENDQVFQSELAAVRQLLPASGRGVDIGVGTGVFASKLGVKWGVEPSRNMAAVAKKKGINVLKGTAEELPLGDNSFDYALMVTADCFLKNIAMAFAEIHRILTAEGVFVIAFLDKGSPLGQQYEANKETSTSYKGAHFRTGAEMSQLLEQAGFQILAARQTVYTMDNIPQQVKEGTGEGIFAVIKAKKR